MLETLSFLKNEAFNSKTEFVVNFQNSNSPGLIERWRLRVFILFGLKHSLLWRSVFSKFAKCYLWTFFTVC